MNTPLPSTLSKARSKASGTIPAPSASDSVSTKAPKTVGRLAPSPTGYLHLGNAWAFLLAWLAARHAGGQMLLRMEDIDPERSRSHFAQAILRDLSWLGLDWDAGPDKAAAQSPKAQGANAWGGTGVLGISYVQSQRGDYYNAALHQLSIRGHTYPCYCTRKELRTLAAAPHVGDAGAPYTNACRSLTPQQCTAHENAGRKAALRLRCPQGAEGNIDFIDLIQGPQHMNLDECGGDFALRRSDGVIAYQLAVVVDDALMGVSQIVRGDDIRISTPRQILLYHLLGYPVPHYAHVPLLLDHEGERLAKRHESLTLGALRDAGVRAEAIVGYLAHRAGLQPATTPCTPAELVPSFNMGTLPTESLTLPSDMLDVLRSLTK